MLLHHTFWSNDSECGSGYCHINYRSPIFCANHSHASVLVRAEADIGSTGVSDASINHNSRGKAGVIRIEVMQNKYVPEIEIWSYMWSSIYRMVF